MATLSTDLRNKLERTCVAARNLAEKAARAALEGMGVQHHEAYGHMSKPQKDLRNKLRAHARQLGDVQDAKGNLSIEHLAQACAYEHWHRMLFARFLAENGLLIEPETGVAVSLSECKELAKDERTNLWALAGRYAQRMLPEVFRADDPVLQVPLAREDQLKLEELLDDLSVEVFTASDSLGWCYQFWQAERKNEVNASGNKIGADELPSVTQLFTEDYMVDFLLDNTLGAWWAGRVLAANPKLATTAKCEEELRKAAALPGCPWKYLRFVKGKDGKWAPAAGTFEGWPKTVKELKCLDPCMGSGHFVVAMFERLVALRMAEEKIEEKAGVAAVIRENVFGLEIDQRCTQIGAFNLALAAWRRVGHCALPAMNLACSGLAPNAREADWVKLAGNSQKLQRGMERLFRLFRNAPVLGSLINPRAGEGDLLIAAFHELQPLVEKALVAESGDDVTHEMAVTARGLAKAAEILAGQFTLVATNVPFLRRGSQCSELQDYVEAVFPEGRADLATAFLQRCIAFLEANGTSACVSQQHFLYLGSYEDLRISLLARSKVKFVVRLGPGAFETISGENVTVALSCVTRSAPVGDESILYCDAQPAKTPADKAELIQRGDLVSLGQNAQSRNPDSRIGFSHDSSIPLLQTRSGAFVGLQNGDTPRFILSFWEVPRITLPWDPFQLTCDETAPYGGRDGILRWENGKGELASAPYARVQGTEAWGRKGVAVRNTIPLPVTLYSGELYDQSSTAIIPRDPRDLPALWAFCSSDEFFPAVQLVDGKRNKTNQTYLKIPFDLAHWQSVAAEKYPHGLPKPFSSDARQWLFNGHPKGSDQPLHVAVARLLGYEWPRQTGSNFPDCPALEPDDLGKLADADGIVCIPSVRGEEPAADRLRKLLAAAYGKDWRAGTELELIRASGSAAGDLEEWLRNEFFEQHCDLFQQRPFVWHVWDGRKRDGFHALVNYHRLGAGAKGRKVLESLTFAYLGEWITRQKDGEKRGDAGAEERLGAALELKERLEAIIEGEPPFDIFVRWKALADQAMGWEPDIDDGVRMNIRPFMAEDLPNGKTGAGVLRWRPKVGWDKDRGKEPRRDKSDFPWFWNGGEFTGDRVNDVHLTNEQKRKARKE